MRTNYRYLSLGLVVFIASFIIFSLKLSTKFTNESPIFTQTTPSTNTTKSTVNNHIAQTTPRLTSNPSKSLFNSDNLANTASNEPDPNLPPGFPEPLPPLDKDQLRQSEDLIAQGDAIVAEMDTLIAGLDLPKIELNQVEQAKLDTQRQIQQTQLVDIKAQLEVLKGGLQ